MALGLLSACGSSAGSTSASTSTSASDAAAATTTTSTSTTEASTGGDLFVVNATGGTLGDGELELTGVDAKVTSFADRPQRSEDREAVEDFVDGWAEQGFDEDPPNAALVTRSADGQVTTVVELGEPVLDGDTLTFPVTPLDAGKASGSLARLPSEDQPEELEQPSLFIDDGASGTLVSVQIDGTWGSGTTKGSLAWWYYSKSGGTSMGFQMGEPGTVSFTTYDAFFTLDTPDAITGTFSGVGLIEEPYLAGEAVVPAGSDLTISICGSGGPSSAYVQGDIYIPIPASC